MQMSEEAHIIRSYFDFLKEKLLYIYDMLYTYMDQK